MWRISSRMNEQHDRFRRPRARPSRCGCAGRRRRRCEAISRVERPFRRSAARERRSARYRIRPAANPERAVDRGMIGIGRDSGTSCASRGKPAARTRRQQPADTARHASVIKPDEPLLPAPSAVAHRDLECAIRPRASRRLRDSRIEKQDAQRRSAEAETSIRPLGYFSARAGECPDFRSRGYCASRLRDTSSSAWASSKVRRRDRPTHRDSVVAT